MFDYGTVLSTNIRSFSWNQIIVGHRHQPCRSKTIPSSQAHPKIRLREPNHYGSPITQSVTSYTHVESKFRNINLISISCPYRVDLRTDSPCHDCHGTGNLRHSAMKVFTSFTLLIPTFSLPVPPANLTVHLLRHGERSATTHKLYFIHLQLRFSI